MNTIKTIKDILKEFQQDVNDKFHGLDIQLIAHKSATQHENSGYYDFCVVSGIPDFSEVDKGDHKWTGKQIIISLTIETTKVDDVVYYADKMVEIPSCRDITTQKSTERYKATSSVKDADLPVYMVNATYNRKLFDRT